MPIYKRLLESNDAARLGLLIILSLVIKAIMMINDEIINPDGIRYINSAYALFNGDFSAAFAHEKMLFYTFTLGLFHFIVRDWFWAGQILSGFFLILTLIPLYFLTKNIFNRNAALWAGLALVVIPSSNELATKVVKDAPYLFFLTLALWLGQKALVEQRISCFALTFLAALIASLYRFEGIVFLLAYFLVLVWYLLRDRMGRSTYLKGVGAYLAIPLLGLVTVFVLIQSGVVSGMNLDEVVARFREHYLKFDFLANYRLIYEHLAAVEENFPGGQWTQDFFEISRHNLFLIYLLGMLLTLVKTLFPPMVIPLLAGLPRRESSGRGLFLLFSIVGSYLLLDYYFIVSQNFLAGRYLMILVVLTMPIIGNGLERLRLRAERLKLAKTTLLVMLLVFFCAPVVKSIDKSFGGGKLEIKEAGLWLQQSRDLQVERIATNEERVTFYAGLMREQYDLLPVASMAGIEKRALRQDDKLLALKISLRDLQEKPVFRNYSLIKEIDGDKAVVLIYERNL